MYKVQLQGRSWDETKGIYLKTTFQCGKTKRSMRCRRDRKRLLLDFSEEMKFYLEKNFLIKTCSVTFQLKQQMKFLQKSNNLQAVPMFLESVKTRVYFCIHPVFEFFSKSFNPSQIRHLTISQVALSI